ncbi:FAD-linked oxidase C-terminal domain-containing protein [Cupriavidus basilensis]
MELSDSEGELIHARGIFGKLDGSRLQRSARRPMAAAGRRKRAVQQSRDFWNPREHIPLAQVEDTVREHQATRHCRAGFARGRFHRDHRRAAAGVVPRRAHGDLLGHLGDGTRHYNVSPPAAASTTTRSLPTRDAVNRVVHDSVHSHGGSISAEHGLGQPKREENRSSKSWQGSS